MDEEDRWQRLQALFDKASGLELSEVDELLDRECSEDTELRRELRSLLRRAPGAKDPLADAVWATAREALAAAEPSGGMGLVYAAEDPGLRRKEAQPEGQEETPAWRSVAGSFAAGEILGKRYRIHSRLGRGGMGEVWRVFDLKLRVDVALKALREDLPDRDRALETLRQEVRVAREVISPNVCRVFELLELDGRELVSMEYIDGTTLAEILRTRSPLELEEAREIASQLLAGLEAIHQAGLVHRDVKPENVMITRSGRVVVMDFGIARGLAVAGTGTVAGTPAYMAPEQERGDVLDARADVFSAGVVLAEMMAPEGIGEHAARQALWYGVREDPPRLPESPWRRVLERAVARPPESRFATAARLARALEEVTLRVEGMVEVTPYPGLAAFTEEDAEYFFGRELEVEDMWRKLRRPHLLALIGPSGAGKSSFLRAGLIPTKTPDWASILFTPGNVPTTSLREALVPEISGDTEAMRELVRVEDPDAIVSAIHRWRKRHRHALIIVDQFEELFTLNPVETQRRFADLLGRLVIEADVFVLLSLRDDFLAQCNAFEPLRPIFHQLTVLDPPAGASLRRAVVQPATTCGYRFEDETLVDEMLAEVEGERGALPLLAFALSRLWEGRDRENGRLTRQVYRDLGGVGGALTRHAETTIDRIGAERLPLVRELFRNLVTAEGTRAVREIGELLSVFEEAQRQSAAKVLAELVDARLLTSYQICQEDQEPTRRVEIIHESLLANWPRLVGWQIQDADSARVRDEVRQAARMWDEHDRTDDRLWTGSAFREFQLWSERYPGGLTTLEEEFARAMIAHAERRKRRRRAALAVVISGLLAVLAIVTWSRFEAVAEARRAEAAKLLAFAQARLEEDPTEALAFATASLELADTEQARIFAIRALSEGPPARVLDGQDQAAVMPAFSRDGRWLAVAGMAHEVHVWSQTGEERRLPKHKSSPGPVWAGWSEDGYLATGHSSEQRARIWSFPGGEEAGKIDFGAFAWWGVARDRLVAQVVEIDSETEHMIFHLRAWRLPDGEVQELGSVDWTALGASFGVFDYGGSDWFYGRGNEIFHRPLPVREGVADRLVGRQDNDLGPRVSIPAEPNRLWTRDASTGELSLWDLSVSNGQPLQVISRPADATEDTNLDPDPSGRWLMGSDPTGIAVKLWDLEALPSSRGLQLRRRGSWYASNAAFHPGAEWIAMSVSTARGAWDQVAFWPLPQRPPSVIEGYDHFQRPLTVSPDGDWLVSSWSDGSLRLWPLPGNVQRDVRVLGSEGGFSSSMGLVFDPSGRLLAGSGWAGEVSIASLEDGSVQRLEGFPKDHLILGGAAFSPSGRLFAAGSGMASPELEKELRIWDLETGESRVFSLEQTRIPRATDGEEQVAETPFVANITALAFTDESTLYSAGHEGLLRWNLEDGTWERFVAVESGHSAGFQLADDRQRLITSVVPPSDQCGPGEPLPLVLHELRTGGTRNLTIPAIKCSDGLPLFDGSLSVYVAGEPDGTLRVGRVKGGEPHLLIGHQGPIDQVVISPDLEWIASTGEDRTIRVWPMPDLDRTPLHTLPHEELIAKLQSLTNLRAVRDPASSTGWSIEIDPFPGWEEVPEW